MLTKKYLDEFGDATPEFDALINEMCTAFLKSWHVVRGLPGYTGFYVPAVTIQSGTLSLWGVLDIEHMAEEDVYIEVWRRFFGAIENMGENQITGFGILDMAIVVPQLRPQPMPAPVAPPTAPAAPPDEPPKTPRKKHRFF